MKKFVFVVFVVCIVCNFSTLWADFGPLGEELEINTCTDGNQRFSRIASDESGNFVVVWQSQNQDGSGYGIFARCYDSNGDPIGDEFKINQYTAGDQLFPAVAMNNSGKFIVTWDSQKGDNFEIVARLYDSLGNPLSNEFTVNNEPYLNRFCGYVKSSSVAMDDIGGFVVAWRSWLKDGEGSWETSNIFVRRYNAQGQALGNQFKVNVIKADGPTNCSNGPVIYMDLVGNFVVAWRGLGDTGQDQGGIYGRRLDYNGNFLSGQFPVNTFTEGNQYAPAIGGDDDGNFLVTWNTSTGDSYYDVAAQRFDLNGDPVGDEFKVNTYTANNQAGSTCAMNNSGNFVVAWHSYMDKGGGYIDWEVCAQRFDSNGDPIDGEFVVNTTNLIKDQTHPSVVAYKDEDFTVTWSTNGQDGSGWGIYGQRFGEQPTPTPTQTITSTLTTTPTITSTLTATPTATLTPTVTKTTTLTPTLTKTPTKTSTGTSTVTNTATRTQTPVKTMTPTLTATPTRTATPSATLTQTRTATRTATPILTLTPTQTETDTSTPTATATDTPMPTPTPTQKTDCLYISSPKEFCEYSLILSWTPLPEAENYLLELRLDLFGTGYKGSFFLELKDNQFIVYTYGDESFWQALVNLKEVDYKVTAFDSNGNVIGGPTDWAHFICKWCQ